MKKLLLVLGLVVIAIIGANFSTVKSAIVGHTTDIVERVTVEDQNVDGALISWAEFREDDPGNDAAHWVKGGVTLIWDGNKQYIQLEDNFKAGLAPDLYIYVSTSATPIVDEKTFFATGQVELGKLVKGSGASAYEVPDGIKPTQITIWCKRFSQFMGSATLDG